MENWYERYSSDSWKLELEERVKVGDKFKKLASRTNLVDDAQRKVLSQVEVGVQRHRAEDGGIAPGSVSDEFMLERFDSIYWTVRYSSDTWKLELEERVKVGDKFKKLASRTNLVEDAQREVLLKVQLGVRRHRNETGGIAPDSISDEFMLEQFDTNYWTVRYSSDAWISRLRQRIRFKSGEIPGLNAVVDDVQGATRVSFLKSLAKHCKWVEAGQPGEKKEGLLACEISDSLMMGTFFRRYNDYLRKNVYGTQREPDWLVNSVGRGLAHEIYIHIVQRNEKVEDVVSRLLRKVEINEGDYTLPEGVVFAEDLIRTEAQKLFDQRLMPWRPPVSIDQPSSPETDDGDGVVQEVEGLDVRPDKAYEETEISGLMKMLIAEKRERVEPNFLELYDKFCGDGVLDSREKLRIRLKLFNHDQRSNEYLGRMLGESMQTFRRGFLASMKKIRDWLQKNGLDDIAPQD